MQRKLTPFLILILVPLAIYFRTVSHDFVNWDDNIHIYENVYYRPVTWENLKQFWTTPYMGLYIPLTYTLWGILTWGMQLILKSGTALVPGVYHAINVSLHIVNGLLVFLILRRFHFSTLGCLMGSLFFVVHPLQVEAVAWVAGFRDVLSAALAFLALWQLLICYEKSGAGLPKNKKNSDIAKRGLGNAILATIAYALATLAKPTAIVVPAMAWVLVKLRETEAEEWENSDLWKSIWTFRKTDLLIGLWLLMAVPIMIITKKCQPTEVLESVVALHWRPLVATDATAFYLYKILFPLHLAPDYGRSPTWALEHGFLYWTWLVPFGVVVASGFHKRRILWWGSLAIFVIGFLPVSGLVPFSFQDYSTVADRYLYFSLLGVSLVLGRVFAAPDIRRPMLWTMCLILGLFALKTHLQTIPWKDSLSLWTHEIRINPASYKGTYNLGMSHFEKKNVKEAMKYFDQSLHINPHYPEAHNNKGMLLLETGKIDEGMRHIRRALELKPGKPEALNNYGFGLTKQNRHQEALEYFTQALEANPHLIAAYGNIGFSHSKLRNHETALEWFEKALKFDPRSEKLHFQKALVLMALGNDEMALKSFKRSLEFKPEFADAHGNMGLAWLALGELPKAMECFQKSLAISPDQPEVINNMGMALARSARPMEAMDAFRKALKLNENFAEAHNNLGTVLAQNSHKEKAIEHFQRAVSITPGYAEAHFNLALTLMHLERLDEALLHYEKTIQLNPRHPQAHIHLGLIHCRKGNLDRAVPLFEKVIEMNPKDATPFFNLGLVAASQKRNSDAIRYFSRAVELNPSFTEAKQKLESLRQIESTSK